MTTPTRAIILAAGQGKRLLPLTEDRPKCLIELSGRSLLAWQLLRLQAAGVAEAVIVTGFRADAVEAEVARLGLTMPVRLAFVIARPSASSRIVATTPPCARPGGPTADAPSTHEPWTAVEAGSSS